MSTPLADKINHKLMEAENLILQVAELLDQVDSLHYDETSGLRLFNLSESTDYRLAAMDETIQTAIQNTLQRTYK